MELINSVTYEYEFKTEAELREFEECEKLKEAICEMFYICDKDTKEKLLKKLGELFLEQYELYKEN